MDNILLPNPLWSSIDLFKKGDPDSNDEQQLDESETWLVQNKKRRKGKNKTKGIIRYPILNDCHKWKAVNETPPGPKDFKKVDKKVTPQSKKQ